MKTQHLVKLGNAALAFGIITSTVAGALLIATTPAAAATTADTSSAVSLAWGTDHTDEKDANYATFKNLTLSVSQTKNLVNEGITVAWTGARTTSTGDYSTNFMQVMQCWGDADTGPTAEQCEWGAPSATIGNLTGGNVPKRDLSLGDDPAEDPKLTGDTADPDYLLDPPIESPNQKAYRVPFKAVNGKVAKSTTDISKLFDASTTNEVSAARTGSDGSGQLTFETQTALEAPQLGCGADTTAADGTVAPRSCWLVVVPRGELNLDNSLAETNSNGRITGSPLSESAWKNRMVVKLDFQPVSQSCPLGNPEQRIVGAENIAEAVTSWQPALCKLGTTYGYSLLGDEEARSQIASTIDGAARLAVVTNPLDSFDSAGTTIAYAPVAQDAIVVAFNADYRLTSTSKEASKNGLQVQDLTLNARLVAKLLTQSYPADVPGGAKSDPVVSQNPQSILVDKEFLDLNPIFADATVDVSPAGLMVALGSSDANALVWSWLRADPLASAFLGGEADDWGMRVNPAYANLGLATDTTTDSFPKTDLTIATGGVAGEPGFGTLDMRPYMNDMHEAAYRTLRSDPNNKSSWDAFRTPASYISVGPQIPGSRFIMSITDSASAARYGLTTAKLVNGAGKPTAATDASVNKSVSIMVPSTDAPSVRVTDANKRSTGAYPLAMLSYAAINVCAATSTELADYAKLINYAIGAGQQSGDARGSLPRGYVPLSSDLVGQANATATSLTNGSASAACPQATPTPTATAPVPVETPTPTPTPTPTATKTPKPTKTPAPVVPPVVTPVPVPTATTPVEPVPVVTDPEDAVIQDTPKTPLGVGRAGLAGALALGIPSMIAGPILSRRGRKLGRLQEGE